MTPAKHRWGSSYRSVVRALAVTADLLPSSIWTIHRSFSTGTRPTEALAQWFSKSAAKTHSGNFFQDLQP